MSRSRCGTEQCEPAYNVAAGQAVVMRTAILGPYLVSNDGAASVATTAAPGTNSRYDLIWIRCPDFQQGDANSTAVLGVTQGTAAAAPTKPYASVPVGALVLAEALVPAGVTATNLGVTYTQVALFTVGRGATIPVRLLADRTAMTPYDALSVYRLDIHARETYNGTVWAADGWMPGGTFQYTGVGAALTAGTPLIVPLSANANRGNLVMGTATAVILNYTGMWKIGAYARVSGAVGRCIMAINKNAATVTSKNFPTAATSVATSDFVMAERYVSCVGNDLIELSLNSNVAGNSLAAGAVGAETGLTLTYEGPL